MTRSMAKLIVIPHRLSKCACCATAVKESVRRVPYEILSHTKLVTAQMQRTLTTDAQAWSYLWFGPGPGWHRTT